MGLVSSVLRLCRDLSGGLDALPDVLGHDGFARRVADPGEPPVPEYKRGRITDGGQAVTLPRFGGPMLGACAAQVPEGGGVAAALGGEVSSEPEHVRPLPEPQAGELRS